ncbi:AbiTii domain-containing protein, partial [Streptomyces roseolus]|uniref:AbiTii domain-containing protein n=1 Tax=Streptomyces roseolus TaxID=67358 RepID=UPI00365EC0C5
MNPPDIQGLEQLEGAVLDDKASLASALRRCLMLGGYAHHQELRAWALKELEGYAADDDLPAYRRVPAALEINANVHQFGGITQYTGHRISHHQLPAPARERGVGEMVPIL